MQKQKVKTSIVNPDSFPKGTTIYLVSLM